MAENTDQVHELFPLTREELFHKAILEMGMRVADSIEEARSELRRLAEHASHHLVLQSYADSIESLARSGTRIAYALEQLEKIQSARSNDLDAIRRISLQVLEVEHRAEVANKGIQGQLNTLSQRQTNHFNAVLRVEKRLSNLEDASFVARDEKPIA